MDPVTIISLVGLALVDSTSIGTLVLPLLMLLAPRVEPRRFGVYLATVAGFYAVVGVALVLGAGAVATLLKDAGEATWLRWAQLIVGVSLFVFGVAGDKIIEWARGQGAGEAGQERADAWASRIVGADASYAAVVTVGLAAALIEVASMLPFLAAVGIITAADLSFAASSGVVVVYCAVMIVPAILLLGLRLVLARRVERLLERFAVWLRKATSESIYWVCAIVGFFVAGDAFVALDAAGAWG